MKDYMAPMEGVTNYIYRNAYHRYYHPMDKYFTPFITAKPNKRLSAKEIREVSPKTNQGLKVVPQLLTNHADDFIQTARYLQEEYGHQEINLNLGCPSGTVTAKGKGAGFLGEPELLDEFLEKIFSKLDIKISIKTRVGTHYEEDWDYLLDIYKKYPISELIIHPRILKDYYKNTPRLAAFEKAVHTLTMPLCYNGDLFSREAYIKIAEQFPQTDCFMYGRGLIANPGLVSEIRDQKAPDKQKLLAFHNQIYQDYQEVVSGERNVLFRMKELWSYLIASFEHPEKYAKKIKKAQRLAEYESAVYQLFQEVPLK